MLVCSVIMLGIIGVLFKNCINDCTQSRASYYNYINNNWDDKSIKDQIIELYRLKHGAFADSPVFEMSPVLYNYGKKWDSEKNKIRFGKQSRPKSIHRWINISPNIVRYPYDGYLMKLPLTKIQINQVLSLMSYTQNETMNQIIEEN